VAFSPDQTLIAVADRYNNRIRLIVVAAGAVSTLAGSGSDGFADGIGAAASFYNPQGVAFSPDQTVIAVADRYNNRIRLIVVATGAVSTLAGSGGFGAFADGIGAAASFDYPTGVAFSPDQTLIAVADTGNNRIRLIVVATGAVSTLAGSGSDGLAEGIGAAASFSDPEGVAFSPDQTLVAVADTGNNRIRLVVVATGAVSTLAGSGSGGFADGIGAAASFDYPTGVTFSPDQTLIAVADPSNNLIRLICSGSTLAPPTDAPTDTPTDAPTDAPTATPTVLTAAPTAPPTTVPKDKQFTFKMSLNGYSKATFSRDIEAALKTTLSEITSVPAAYITLSAADSSSTTRRLLDKIDIEVQIVAKGVVPSRKRSPVSLRLSLRISSRVSNRN
jgi:DNA-binding beta-propeller fold protein YncE